MFRGLIYNAKSAVGNFVLNYVARASVAVAFVIAVGFAVAAVATMLVERFGGVTGCWIMAGVLAAIGIIAAIVVSAREHKEEVAEELKENADTQEMISDATAQALIQTPVALLGALFATPGGAATGLSVAHARSQLAARTVTASGWRTVLAGATYRGGARSRAIGRPP